MANFSNYAENKILNHLFRGESFTTPNMYLALFTSNAGLENNNLASQVEVDAVSSGYARVEIPSYDGFSVSTTGQTSNTQSFEFPVATLDWGTITHVALMDNPSPKSGNVIIHGSVANPRAVFSGDTLRFMPGTIIISCD